jgi:cytochrome b6-f complex iron-sulfur subunit
MTGTELFVVGLVIAALLTVAGVVMVAGRRGPSQTDLTGRFDKRASRKDRRRTQAMTKTTVDEVAAPEPDAVETAEPSDPLLDRDEVSAADYSVTRRKFLNRSLGTLWAIFLGQFALAGLGFMWPRLGSGFGSPIPVGKFADLKAQIQQPDGSAIPMFVASAQTWLVPFSQAEQAASSFDGIPVVANDGSDIGLMALWQKCVHLGCRVPSCVPSQGFECPCHGSKYNLHGEYEAGPAPRNMDRFGVSIDSAGQLVVLTGDVFETPRATNKTSRYPLGPFCV